MVITNWFKTRIKLLECNISKIDHSIDALNQSNMDLEERLDTFTDQISDMEISNDSLDDDIRLMVQKTLKSYLQTAFGIEIPNDKKT